MSIKRRIWLLPILAAATFAVGLATVLFFSSGTSNAIESLAGFRLPDDASEAHFGPYMQAATT
jgi:hypothetical protein